MRVIAGTAKGFKLFSPKDESIRPTVDRVKESVYNILGQYFEGLDVLDLFAGSGANGIEFLSRGANLAIFIDASEEAIKIINKNLEHTKLKEKAQVFKMDYKRFLKTTNDKFNFIYLDPPFEDLHKYKTALRIIRERSLLKEKGLVIAEVEKTKKIDSEGYEMVQKRDYGNTSILFFEILWKQYTQEALTL